MKTRTLLLTALFITAFLCVSALAGEYTVKYYLGKAEYKKAGQDKWQTVTINLKLTDGDSIRTWEESRLELTTGKGLVFKITEMKKLGFAPPKAKKAPTIIADKKTPTGFLNRLKLLMGQASARKFTSPTAVAAIRGKAAGGFAFVDANGDGLNDNFIDEDNSALANQSLGVNESLLGQTNRLEIRGRHGIHNDERPEHCGSGHCH